ncbi:MAG TPA: phosphate acetyltransferase [Caldilineae bacterium]|nr:phosphate acetyltransferase [Caldilineae bacterium]HIQ12620.1 phosphate acetyltransferase [Caldilineales bacterium]
MESYKSLYLATTETHCGKSLVSLGIMDLLLRRTQRVGVFRPIIKCQGSDRIDKNIDLLLKYFHLPWQYEETYAWRQIEALDLLAQGRHDELINRVIAQYKALEEKSDFVLIIGSDLSAESAALDFDINVELAQSLGSPVLLVARGDKANMDEIISPILMAVESFKRKGNQLVGSIVNRVDPDELHEVRRALRETLPEEAQPLAVIPADKDLASPSMAEVVEHLGAEVLYGKDLLNYRVYEYMIIAMQMEHYLERLRKWALLITPGDRGDVILSAIQAHASGNYPRLAGILLTTGVRPAPTVKRLLDGLPSTLPIVAVTQETFETARDLRQIRSYITADKQDKIAISLRLFRHYADTDALIQRYADIKPRGIPPRMFLYNIMQQAKADKKRIVLPEGDDARILRAAEALLMQDVVDVILLGEPEKVRAMIRRLGLSIPNDTPIIDPNASSRLQDYAATYYELRKHKGVTPDQALDIMHDIAYFGTMMVYKGHADGMVSGAAHTTAHTLRPAFEFIKTKPGFSIVSSVFFMALEDRVLVYGDCAVVPKPTAEQLAEIAIASAETAQMFGIEPIVAMLSYSTGESGQGEEVERVRKATQLAKERRPDLIIEGPMQYDAAVDPEVARKKMPGSRVAGRATVFIFPDLNTGNNTYKAVQRETGAIAIGPVLQGLRKPVNDLSRGCTVEDIINTVAITAVQAQHA